MRVALQVGAIKKFRRTPWRFQRTFHTPLKSLVAFTTTMLESSGEICAGTIVIDAVVFSPTELGALLTSHSLPGGNLPRETSITAETGAELRALLVATFSGWVDFLFIPSPKPFIVYADHDEYSTFFANSKANLNAVTVPLTANGFVSVEDYTRHL